MKGDNRERIQISYCCLMEEKRRLLQTISDTEYTWQTALQGGEERCICYCL